MSTKLVGLCSLTLKFDFFYEAVYVATPPRANKLLEIFLARKLSFPCETPVSLRNRKDGKSTGFNCSLMGLFPRYRDDWFSYEKSSKGLRSGEMNRPSGHIELMTST